MTVFQPVGSENHIAPEGYVFVCNACGRRSKDTFGEMPISRGWDAACMLEATLCEESTVVLNERGIVTSAIAVPYAEES